MSITGRAKISAFSFKSQLGIPSGPVAFMEFRATNFLKTDFFVTDSGQSFKSDTMRVLVGNGENSFIGRRNACSG